MNLSLSHIVEADTARRRADRALSHAIAQRYPDAYFVASVGWCGTDWQEAAALERRLRADRFQPGDIVCTARGPLMVVYQITQWAVMAVDPANPVGMRPEQVLMAGPHRPE